MKYFRLLIAAAVLAAVVFAQNPVVRLSYVVPFSSQAATATATSSAIRIPNLSGYGTLTVTGSGITGSPAGCQVALEMQQSVGAPASSAFVTQSFTPGNSYQAFQITPGSSFTSGDTLVAVYSCSTYPTAGTITVTFDPAVPAALAWPLPAGSNVVGGVTQSGTWSLLGTLADNGAAAATNRLGVLPATVESSLPSAGKTAGRDAALSVFPDGSLAVNFVPALYPTSYSASAAVTVAASATDVAVLPGSASKAVLVTRVKVACTQTTAGIVPIYIIRRSTADSAGTSAAMTVLPDDPNYAAGTALPLSYTANPTLGTSAGPIDSYPLGCLATSTGAANDYYILNRTQKPLVLRGTGQQLAVNLNGLTASGATLYVTFEYIETTTP